MGRPAFSAFAAIMTLCVLTGTAQPAPIEVLIKGIDDGVRSSRDRDYKEAVMNAKLQAIERAGVEISSVTKVENFALQYDMVESRARAVLLAGFQIIDMGYQRDGTYQIVLAGKVQPGAGESSRGALQVKLRSTPVAFRSFTEAFDHWTNTFPGGVDNDYVNNENGSITDRKTGLMWTFSYEQAESAEKAHACLDRINKSGFAGHGDWRLPTLAELSSLVEKTSSASLAGGRGSFVAPVFDAHRYCWYLWSADTCPDGHLLVYVGEEKGGICIAGEHYDADDICVACVKAVRTLK